MMGFWDICCRGTSEANMSLQFKMKKQYWNIATPRPIIFHITVYQPTVNP